MRAPARRQLYCAHEDVASRGRRLRCAEFTSGSVTSTTGGGPLSSGACECFPRNGKNYKSRRVEEEPQKECKRIESLVRGRLPWRRGSRECGRYGDAARPGRDFGRRERRWWKRGGGEMGEGVGRGEEVEEKKKEGLSVLQGKTGS
jgi:hypothetical protein